MNLRCWSYPFIQDLYLLSLNAIFFTKIVLCLLVFSYKLTLIGPWSLETGWVLVWKLTEKLKSLSMIKYARKNKSQYLWVSWDYFDFISVRGNYSAKKFCWKFTLDIQYSNDYLFFFYPFSIHFKQDKKIFLQTNILKN